MFAARIVRLTVAGMLLTASALKLGWFDGGPYASEGFYLPIALAELALGIGLLIPRIWTASALGASILFFGFVGFGIGDIARSGIGMLSRPCGCLGAAVDPSRGVTLLVASVGLVLASWLHVRSTRRAGTVRSVLPGLGPLVFSVVLVLSWVGVLGTPVRDERASTRTDASPHIMQASSAQSPPRLEGRPPEPAESPATVASPDQSPPEASPVLRVSVREAGTERALAGVAVWIPHGSARVVTSPDGEATIALESALPTEVVALTPQGVWGHADVPADVTSVSIRIPTEVRLAGTVVWDDGTPARGFRLKVDAKGFDRPVEDVGNTPPWSERRVALDAETDNEGRFAVPGLSEETSAVLTSRDDHAQLLAGGMPGARGRVWAQLPAMELRLVAIAGLHSSVRFIDSRTGGAVGGLEANLDWPHELTAYAGTENVDSRRACVDFVWPVQRGSPIPALTGRASARGYVTRSFDLRASSDTREFVVELDPDASCRIVVRHPWGTAVSARSPQFSVYCDDSPVSVSDLGLHDTAAAEQDRSWVFAGLPPGRCSVRCFGVEIASAELTPGGSATVQAKLDSFSRLVLRPRRDGRPLTGTVKLVTSGIGRLEAREFELPGDGTIEMFPLPVGTLRVRVSRAGERSDPAALTIEVPGNGETVVVDVPMVPR
jgi:hypothetical protein